MNHNQALLALDVGEKRIGVAVGYLEIGIAIPQGFIEVDGHELETIAQLVARERVATIVVGYPRNQSGEPTAQSAYVETFAKGLHDIAGEVVFQDESLSSVMAEQRLIDRKKPYGKGDIDSEAATIILQDYLEAHR